MNPFMLDQAAMYSAYHRDRRNIATHVVGVPAIVLALLLVLNLVPLEFALAGLTLAWVVFILAAVFYLWMHTLGGFLVDVLLLLATWGTQVLAETLAPTAFWSVTAVLFIGGWALQLVGHGFEGRRPALADNLLQILMAPLFLVFEALFALGLARDVAQAVAQRMPDYAQRGNATA
jgi:uncharacterized membrane protein YGL010W